MNFDGNLSSFATRNPSDPSCVRPSKPALALSASKHGIHALGGDGPCWPAAHTGQRLRRLPRRRQRLHWKLRQRQTIFRLLLEEFGRMIGSMPKDDHRRVATLWRVTVESWLRRQGLISVQQNQNQKVSTNFPENWSHD
jgi:hypothetical protein